MSELGKPFLKKNQIKKIKQKIGVKMPHVNKTTLARKKIWLTQKTMPIMSY